MKVAQVAVLLLTALTLVATSRAPCSTNVPETQLFAVTGNCGPSGMMAVTSAATCSLVVDGGVPLSMPLVGEQPAVGPIRGQNITLNSFLHGADGGTVDLTDGGVRSFSTSAATGLCVGCPGSMGNYRSCSGVADDAGVVTLSCSTDDGPLSDSCTAVLTPMP